MWNFPVARCAALLCPSDNIITDSDRRIFYHLRRLMARIRLRHIHLPASSSDGIFPTYQTAAAVQELLRRRLLNFKDSEASSSHPATHPHPTLISFTPQPTYTLGRRQGASSSLSSLVSSSSLSPSDIERLKAPLHIRASEPRTLPALGVVPCRDEGTDPSKILQDEHVFNPSVMTSPRGGLATYHGPGQVVLWPVMAINSPSPLGYKHFTVRCYSRLLENTTTALLQRLFGLKGFTTEDPGVWVRTPARARLAEEEEEEAEAEEEVRKISALGIHLRRHVSSLGAAINLDMPTTRGLSPSTTTYPGSPAGNDEQSNPWARFVACGLEGKGVTCVSEELRLAGGNGIPGLDAEIVARAWAEELVERMELDRGSVEMVGKDEVEEIVARAEAEGYLEAVGKEKV